MTDWEFELGATVYLKTDPHQFERIVVERTEKYGGSKSYWLACGDGCGIHYPVEITEDYNQCKALDIREPNKSTQ